MNKYIKVEDHKHLVRDSSTNGIVNIDNNAYSTHKKNKLLSRKRQEKENNQESRINTLEKKIDSVEQTLSKILDILTNGNP